VDRLEAKALAMPALAHETRPVARRGSPVQASWPVLIYCRAHMKLPVTLERDETGMIVAECPAIPGCVSQGRTEQEALANIKEAIIGCLEVRAERGLPLTVRTVEVDVAVA
jgi:predicted RNase H-like HicB family nuclease